MLLAMAGSMRAQKRRKGTTAMKTEIRGRGRPALPAGDATCARVTVRLDQADSELLAQLAEALDCSEAEAMRVALRELAARKVRS